METQIVPMFHMLFPAVDYIMLYNVSFSSSPPRSVEQKEGEKYTFDLTALSMQGANQKI